MRIVDKTKKVTDAQLFSVREATYVDNYKIRVKFTNGKTRTIDCGNFLKKQTHPSLKKYLNISQFKIFRIQNGNINWNNYEMIFPVEALYKEKVD